MVGENSKIIESRVAKPTAYSGIKGLSMLNAVWIVRAAPTNIEMIPTMGKELIPNEFTSKINCLQKRFHCCGLLKTCEINRK
jgi:hypothetical protein